MEKENRSSSIVQLSSGKFLLICAALSALILAAGRSVPFTPGVLAAEVFITIFLLFILGSFRYQLDKNALTYGAVMVIAASFFTSWWPRSSLSASFHAAGFSAIPEFLRVQLLAFHRLDELIHLDTMLFILGLTFYVAVIAQSRMLESLSFSVLKKTKGNVLWTVAIITAIVSLASGVLDGVSMIGLLIRTLVIILSLVKADDAALIFSVIISTVVTTVCGMWLAYGEPPNLIMKANLHPYLTNAFFLAYCLPVAVGAYFIVLWNLRRFLTGMKVDMRTLVPPDASSGSRFPIAMGAISLVPFIGLLIWHGRDHTVPLFWAAFAAFAAALAGLVSAPTARRAALKEAALEYREYLFLFPLFLSITLLQKSGFFGQMPGLMQAGTERIGRSLIAFVQFAGACFLSALLDNNVVADFASRALHGLELGALHLFSMAQMAGYAAGGCWTHIGSAQSVVAYAFIRREIDRNYTPVQWMRLMTPIVLQIFVLMFVVIFGLNFIQKFL